MTQKKLKAGAVDLHMHSVFSDGTLTPEELVGECVKHGVRIASLTDHDTVAGVERFIRQGICSGITAVSGLELSSVLLGKEIHILGYGFDPSDETLLATLERLRAGREKRAEAIAEKLIDFGITIDITALKDRYRGKSLGRPAIADMMIEMGCVADRREAFERYLAEGRPAFVDKIRVDAYEGMDIIRKAGGISVWAHPALNAGTEGEEMLKLLSDHGLDGVEAFSAAHTCREASMYAGLAARYGLYVTSGSDFHKPGEDGKHNPLGSRSYV